jgi:AraC-like DNA-binding protein
VLQQAAAYPSGVTVSFALPAPELRPYVTTYYHTEVAPDCAPFVEDYLHPEWGNVRFTGGDTMWGAVGSAPLQTMSAAVAAGPTSYATRFRAVPGRYWGIGLLPLGWARFVAARASERADRLVDVGDDRAFAAFRPLLGAAFSDPPDQAAEARRIDALMLTLLERPAREEERIAAIHAALVDPEVATVSALAARAGLPVRSLERIAKNVFGFTPKLLLRRQRFLRSLAQFMLDPSLAWLSTMDDHYHDQAQFIRDFRRFMGMTPSAYAALPHPILSAAAHARNAAVGAAMQVLHAPPQAPAAREGLR